MFSECTINFHGKEGNVIRKVFTAAGYNEDDMDDNLNDEIYEYWLTEEWKNEGIVLPTKKELIELCRENDYPTKYNSNEYNLCTALGDFNWDYNWYED